MLTLFYKGLKNCVSCLPITWSTKSSKPQTFALYNTDRKQILLEDFFKQETYEYSSHYVNCSDGQSKFWVGGVSFALHCYFFDSPELAVKYTPFCHINYRERIFVLEMAGDPPTMAYLASINQLHLGIMAISETTNASATTNPKTDEVRITTPIERMPNPNFDLVKFREATKNIPWEKLGEVRTRANEMYFGLPGQYNRR